MCDSFGVSQDSTVCLTPVFSNESRLIEWHFIVSKNCINPQVMLYHHPLIVCLDQGRLEICGHFGQAIILGVLGKLNIWRPFRSKFNFFSRPKIETSNILKARVQIADNLRRNCFARGNQSFPAPYSGIFR